MFSLRVPSGFFVFSRDVTGLLQELVIREFSFHQLNANLLWPGTFAFADWLVQNSSWVQGRRCIELGRYNYSIILVSTSSRHEML